MWGPRTTRLFATRPLPHRPHASACSAGSNRSDHACAPRNVSSSDPDWILARDTWHQDLTIAVRETASAADYGPWSVKAGIVHVQPPIAVLERMIAVRIHLDDCASENGPVRVLAGSHRLGRLSTRSIADAPTHHREVTCALRRGGLLAMRPLLLHASSAAVAAGRRRVLHIEFAACELAPGVEWFERWQCSA